MRRFRFYLDNQPITEPIGWDDIVTEIDRDLEIYGLLVKTNIALTFIGDGYDYIKCVFDANSFCQEIAITIEEQCSEDGDWEKVVTGLLSCVDMEFDLTKCLVKCQVEDNSYFARIRNNQSIEAYPHVGKSKSGVSIAPATLEGLKMFIPSTGAPTGTRYAYRVFELYSFLVAFMSDGEVDFKSTLFDVGGEFEGLFVTNGLHISTASASDFTNPDIGKMSFKKLNEEVFKICNIGFTIETIAGRPTLVIEGEDYFYGTAISDTLNNVLNVTKKVKTELLYSKLHIGSSTTLDSPTLSFPEHIQFLGFNDEEYQLTGQCNVDKTFDLLGEWIRSSNIIEDCFVNNNPSYDEDFIFIMSVNVSANLYQAQSYDIFGTGAAPFYYNEPLTNKAIVERFLNFIPASIALFLGPAIDGTFLATRTADASHSGIYNEVPTLFDDDFTPPNHDSNNYYGNGTAQGTPVIAADCRYTAPQAGLYHFETRVYFDVTAYVDTQYPHGLAFFSIFLIRYDAAGNVIIAWNDQTAHNSTGTFSLFISQNVILNTGDYVEVKIHTSKTLPADTLDYDIKAGSYFKCDVTFLSGGVYAEGNIEDFKAIQYIFKYTISYARFKNIKTQYRNTLAFNLDGVHQIKAWIENIKYHHMTSEAELILLGTQKKTNDTCTV